MISRRSSSGGHGRHDNIIWHIISAQMPLQRVDYIPTILVNIVIVVVFRGDYGIGLSIDKWSFIR